MRAYSDLSDEELVNTYKESDKADKDLILDIMILRYHGVIASIAAPYFLVGADREDLIQEGRIGLYEAVKSYEADKNDKFMPFARMCIERAQIKAIQKYNRKKNQPLNNSISIDDEESEAGSLISYDTKVSDPEEIYFDAIEVSDKLFKLREDLSPLEINVLTYMMEGYDYKQIAKILGRPAKSVDNTIQRIRKKSKDILID